MARREQVSAYLLIAPMVIGWVAVVLVPIGIVLYTGLQEQSLLTGASSYVGLGNYVQMVRDDPLFWPVLINSIVFTALLVPTNVLVALGLALVLSRQIPGRVAFRTLFFAPVVASIAAWDLVWRFILQGQQGTLNAVLAAVGLDGTNWLNTPETAMLAAVVTLVIKNVGLNMIILLAALTQVPRDLVDAARTDGAATRQVIGRVTIPIIAPALLLVVVLTVIGCLGVFDHILLLTAGGPGYATTVLAYYIYFSAFRTYDVGYASALATVLFLVAVALTAVQWRVRGRFAGLDATG